MKKSRFYCFACLVFVGLLSPAFAQKVLTDGTFTYTISTEGSGEKTAAAKSLEGATSTLYIRGSQSRVDMSSSLGSESNIYDSKLARGAILKQYSGQKLMITLTSANWMQKNQLYQSVKFSIDNNVVEVAGFPCKKATGTAQGGKTFIIYFTPGIIIQNKQYDNAFAQLPGLPVQYEIESGKLRFKYTLSNVNYDPVPAAKFEIPKTGFRTMSYEETQQLRKAD